MRFCSTISIMGPISRKLHVKEQGWSLKLHTGNSGRSRAGPQEGIASSPTKLGWERPCVVTAQTPSELPWKGKAKDLI